MTIQKDLSRKSLIMMTYLISGLLISLRSQRIERKRTAATIRAAEYLEPMTTMK
jgi:hypothetical protein